MSNRDGGYFPLGSYDSGVAADGTTLVNSEWLGQCIEKVNRASTRVGKRPDNTILKVIMVRNLTGGVVYGKKFYLLNLGATSAEAILESVSGVSDASGKSFVVLADPYLPSAGVPANGIFYGVVKGKVTATLPALKATFNGDIAIGDKLVATSAGAIAKPAAPADATAAQAMAPNFLAIALEAKDDDVDTSGTIKVALDIPMIPC